MGTYLESLDHITWISTIWQLHCKGPISAQWLLQMSHGHSLPPWHDLSLLPLLIALFPNIATFWASISWDVSISFLIQYIIVQYLDDKAPIAEINRRAIWLWHQPETRLTDNFGGFSPCCHSEHRLVAGTGGEYVREVTYWDKYCIDHNPYFTGKLGIAIYSTY